jgi:hypothetical protein
MPRDDQLEISISVAVDIDSIVTEPKTSIDLAL